jgi:nicotinamidase-related amidase
MNIPLIREPAEQLTFADHLADWYRALAPLPLEKLLRDAADPRRVGIFCVDAINGFCYEGQLESPRIRAIIRPIVDLMTRAHAQGVRTFVLTQDCHPADSVEFRDFPVHCVRGTSEADTVPEIANLPFANTFTVIRKTTISSSVRTDLDPWLDGRPDLTHQVVVGDCTDLCVYQLAMHLKLRANAANEPLPVIVPADCVDTYDLPVDVAESMGVPAHPGDFYHRTFLHHMALNGVQVVSSIL